MKRNILIALLLVVAMFVVGCASNQPEQTPSPADEPTVTPEDSQETDTPSEPGYVPTKDIQIIVPFAAGGTTDIPCRIFAKYMTEYGDVDVSVVNITGGSGGSVGAKAAQEAEPDGSTLVVQPVSFPMMSALGTQDFTYEDFEMVGLWLDSTVAVVVSADSEYETMDDLIAAATAAPGEVAMGAVSSTMPFFAVLEIEQQKGVEFKKVDLAETNKSSELLGGRVDGYIDAFGQVRQFVDSGDFRCLGVITDSKIQGYEDIPTFDELGFENFEYLKQVQGMWAPKGTSAEAIDYINNLMKLAAEDPECKAEFAELAYNTTYMTVEDYTQFMADTYATFKDKAKLVLGE